MIEFEGYINGSYLKFEGEYDQFMKIIYAIQQNLFEETYIW